MMTFWCRRWMEHSRSTNGTTVPCSSPSTSTSTWRTRSRSRSSRRSIRRRRPPPRTARSRRRPPPRRDRRRGAFPGHRLVYRADPVRRSVRYRHERQAPGGPSDVVDEDPAAEEVRGPQDGVAQAAAAYELLDDGLAGEVRQVGVQAGVGDRGPDEPFDPGSCCRLGEHGRLIDGLQVGQPRSPVPDGRLVVPAPEVRHEHPAAAQLRR